MIKKLAFTLIELLITIGIVTALAMIAVPSYSNYRIRSKVSAMINTASAAELAVANDYFNQGYTFSNTNFTANSQPFLTSEYDFITSITVTNGVITITGNPNNLGGRQINLVFTPSIENNNITWTCTVSSTFFDFVPASCKNAL